VGDGLRIEDGGSSIARRIETPSIFDPPSSIFILLAFLRVLWKKIAFKPQ